jgi:hypothetical protein
MDSKQVLARFEAERQCPAEIGEKRHEVTVLVDLRAIVVRPVLLVRLPLHLRLDRKRADGRGTVGIRVRACQRDTDGMNVLADKAGFAVVRACAEILLGAHGVVAIPTLGRHFVAVRERLDLASRRDDLPALLSGVHCRPSLRQHYCTDKIRTSQGSFLDFFVFCPYTGSMSTTSQKRRGRPPKGSGAVKGFRLEIRLDEAEKDGFRAAAELSGLELSGWIRERLRSVAWKELERAGQPVPFRPK